MQELIKKITEEKENLAKEKKEMFEKLQAGEGVSTALQQLSTEKARNFFIFLFFLFLFFIQKNFFSRFLVFRNI